MHVHRVSNVTQINTHKAEPLVIDNSSSDVDISDLKSYKSPCEDPILEELISTGGEYYGLRSIKTVILRIRKKCLIGGRSLSLYQFTKKGRYNWL
jgi:hypothetical protein